MTLSSSARRSRRLDFTPVQAEALADSGQDNDATKEDITNLRADLIVKFADLKVETVRWIVGAVAFNLIGTAGLIIALVRTSGR